MRYAVARYNESQRDMAYRFYVAESLRITTENTAMAVRGSYMQNKFINIIHPSKKDARTGDDIAMDVIKNAGLEVDLSEFV